MKRLSASGIWIVCILFFVGCHTPGVMVSAENYHQKYKQGPPPHAPAHGYRYQNYQGHDLKYDLQKGVYLVLNVPETYFADNLYIRYSSHGTWSVSTYLGTGWRVAVGNEVPLKLKTYKEKGKGKAKGKLKKMKHKNGKYKKYDD